MIGYIILWNDGVFEGGRVFDSLEDIKKMFKEEFGVEKLVDEEYEEVSVENLLEIGSGGEKFGIYNKELVEMGDEWVDISIIKLYK